MSALPKLNFHIDLWRLNRTFAVICAILTALAVIGVVLYSIFLTGSQKDAFHDHERGAVEAGCITCHASMPNAAADVRPEFRPNAGKWCMNCHNTDNVGNHPVGVPASPATGLPLEGGSLVSCITCHSPHQPRYAEKPWTAPALSIHTKDGYKTFFLRHENSQGELCIKCHDRSEFSQPGMNVRRSVDARLYAGSQSCIPCHRDIYNEWRLSAHARMTRKPGEIDGFTEIQADGFGYPRERVKFVLGSHYVHRFVAKVDGLLVVLPGILDRETWTWLPQKDYGWRKRSWIRECAGCHTTGFSSENESFIETGVGCEACHGPAINHVRTGTGKYVVSIKSLPLDRREMICESCHTSGVDKTGKYHFPEGYKPGEDLTRFYFGLTPKPGQDHDNFLGDETYADRRRQWDFLKNRLFLASGLTCDYCQNFRNFKTSGGSDYMTHDQYCLTCHKEPFICPDFQKNDCTKCHAPEKTADGSGFSIHDHKFSFGTPLK